MVLGYQDPKLVEVMRDAPTLSKEGRSIVLQTIASMNFHLQSFDIKTAFLRGKADETNPLAMEPPAEIRKALDMQPNEVCLLLGNAYGRVDAPLLFYKELTQQLEKLGFTRHPLEPCIFLLYSGSRLRGIIGMHVDDGVCGGDSFFQQKVAALEEKLPFGSQKHKDFIFTGIHLEQYPDFTIKADQREYISNIPQIDIGRLRRQTPTAEISEHERTRLRADWQHPICYHSHTSGSCCKAGRAARSGSQSNSSHLTARQPSVARGTGKRLRLRVFPSHTSG